MYKKLGCVTPHTYLISRLLGPACRPGGIIAAYASLSNSAVGILLAMAAGLYIYIGTCECLASLGDSQTIKDVVARTLFLLVGCTAVGLVLLGHQHCEVGTDDHSGHAH